MRKSSFVLASFSVLALAASAQATLLVEEGFNYSIGADIGGKTGGTGWSGGWYYDTDFNGLPDATPPAQNWISATGLTYPGLTTSGNSAQRNPTDPDNNYPFVRKTATDINGYVSDLWVTALYANPNASNNAYLYLGEFGRGFGFNGNNIYLGSRSGTNVQAAFTQGTGTHLFVMKLAQGTGTAQDAQLWVDPTDLTTLGTPSLTYTFSNAIYASEISLEANYVPAKWDEIRLGTTQGDVLPVPEPMSLGLIGISAMGLLTRRRPNKA